MFRRQDNIYKNTLEQAHSNEIVITKPLPSDLDNNIYVNIQINGDANNKNGNIYQPHKRMTFSQAFNDSFINDIENYYVSIITLTISSHSIPLIYFDDIDTTQTANPNLTTWVFTFSFNGNDYSKAVVFTSATTQQPPLIPGSQSSYYHLSNYNSLVLMLNNTIASIYSDLYTDPAVAGFLGPGDRPFIFFDEDKEKFTLVYNKNFIGSGIQLFCSDSFVVKFSGFFMKFHGVSGNNKDYEFLFNNLPNNGFDANSNVNVQQYSTVQNFQTINQLIVSSNSLKCRNEYVLSESTNLLGSASILFSLNPLLEDLKSQKSMLVYTTNGNYRLVDILSKGYQKNLDISVFYTNAAGQLFPVFIAENESATIKLGFFKKSLFNNQY